jgi:aminoglycoside phosphotransferase (APT) family kinase protein
MRPAWTPEREVSAEMARALIEEQFSTLAPARVQLAGTGWDNTAFYVNDTLIFRFPRRQIAVGCLEAETRLMPALGSRLPLPVPQHAFVARPTEAFPWLFSGYPRIPGRTACGANLDDDQRLAAAGPLGRFLAALHAIPTAEAARLGAGPDIIGRLNPARYLPRTRDRLQQLAGSVIDDTRPLVALLDSAPSAYTARADTLVHGDLYTRHLLVDDENRLAGVIDWGDTHLGDAAADLAVAHTFLPPAAHAAFRESYGPVDDAVWAIARLRGLWHTIAVLAFAVDVGDADLVRESRRALQHLAAA